MRTFTILMVFSLSACASAYVGPRTLESIETDIARLNTQIKAAVGYPRCDTLSDCDAIATGFKPCGGPNRWVAYSKVQSNLGLLQDHANRRIRLEREYISLTGLTSDCAIEIKPNTSCRRSVCEIIAR